MREQGPCDLRTQWLQHHWMTINHRNVFLTVPEAGSPVNTQADLVSGENVLPESCVS